MLKEYIMKVSASSLPKRFVIVPMLLIMAFSFGACSVKLVSDYDDTTFEEILSIGKKVDKFYGELIETPEANRQYQVFVGKYVEIETDIRSLYTRNKARSLNSETTEITNIILTLWTKYKSKHQLSDRYSSGTAKLDRGRFGRLFSSAASSEIAKKELTTNDKNVDKDSE
jgi:hypothetical protein